MVGGDLELAAASYKAALRLSPGLTSCWCNLGNVQVKTGKPQEAIAYYLEALKLSPSHWPTRTNLVQALTATKQYIIAKALLLELTAERPEDGAIHHQLGKVHFELDEIELALARFEQAIALNPQRFRQPLLDRRHQAKIGRQRKPPKNFYARAAQIQPLIRRPAIKSPADFRVLALYAPFGGNTPTEYLFKNAGYETDTLALFENNAHDAEAFRPGRSGRRKPYFRCRPGRRFAGIDRRFGRPARQTDRQRSPENPANHAGHGGGAARGHPRLPHPKDIAAEGWHRAFR